MSDTCVYIRTMILVYIVIHLYKNACINGYVCLLSIIQFFPSYIRMYCTSCLFVPLHIVIFLHWWTSWEGVWGLKHLLWISKNKICNYDVTNQKQKKKTGKKKIETFVTCVFVWFLCLYEKFLDPRLSCCL